MRKNTDQQKLRIWTIFTQCNRQRNDTNNYEQLDFDLTELHTEKIKPEINNLNNETFLTSKTANFL